MVEIWEDILGYEGLYQISNLGNVRSLKYWGGKRIHAMSPIQMKNGYWVIRLYKDKGTKGFLIHRLVAQAFIPNPDNLEMVNHKDENKSNNCVDNLEWCTRSYNQIYSMNLHEERRKKFGENFKKNGVNTSPYTKKGQPHTCLRAVVQKDLQGNVIARFDNPAEAEFKTGLKNINTACKRNEKGTPKRRCKGIYKYLVKDFVFEYE